MSGERGNAALELVLGVCVLVLPSVMLVAVLPTWSARQALAEAIAREAARVYVLAAAPDDGRRAAQRVRDLMVHDHGERVEEFSLRMSDRWARGGSVTAEVRTTVPIVQLPLFGRVGGFPLVEQHTEQIDPFRSW